jgi:hypothetical protein
MEPKKMEDILKELVVSHHSNDEIMANRRKVIDYLKNPKLIKAKGVLRNAVGGRCCLGHMCDALGVEAEKVRNQWWYNGEAFRLPVSVRLALGMTDSSGSAAMGDCFSWKDEKWSSLATLNDETTIKPFEIAAMLETMIDGGPGTPFLKLEANSTP